MSDLLEKCAACRALLDEEDLFCSNCGAEAPHDRPDREFADGQLMSTHNFDCQGCGASMSYDASAQTLRCPFCGSEKLEQREDARALAPRQVVPFSINRETAQKIMIRAASKGFWRPKDMSERAVITKMTAVYVPYWVFRARTFTYWTGDSSDTPFGARGDWCPMTGENRSRFSGLLVGASGALTPTETRSLCPFDLSGGVATDQVDLDNVVVEQFRVPRKYARPLARRGLEESERQTCARYIPGRSRHVKVNVRMEGLTSEPILLPVWIMAYRYEDKVYRFLVNGQTGKAAGEAPFAWGKLAMIVAIVAAVLVGGFVLLLAAGAIASMF
ncbi:MAG: hypothetical protein QGG36_22630 [Pirellulaceae bacterium]|jgi:predicted RNA-binding Zn-ribbon protein involved in translation (DUF1610 family)|nr:hypothetical protein [Pirellulaceae bacterium]MDP7018612.1 hypothetical protein [Pirellulaceae bacterium]